MIKQLRFRAGDAVRIAAASARPGVIGRIYTVKYVGPWAAGEAQPTGGYAVIACDYILDDPDHTAPSFFAPGISCRESNLEAV